MKKAQRSIWALRYSRVSPSVSVRLFPNSRADVHLRDLGEDLEVPETIRLLGWGAEEEGGTTLSFLEF